MSIILPALDRSCCVGAAPYRADKKARRVRARAGEADGLTKGR